MISRRLSILQRVARILCATLLFAPLISGVFSSPAGAAQYHTVTFAQNDNDADPVYATQTQNAPTALMLFSSISPAFTNTGRTFLYWNTQPDGSGTSYSDGGTYDFGAALLLYAIWTNTYHTVTYAENNSAGDVVAATQTANTPTALTSFNLLNPSFSRSGYTFIGWNTQANGNGTSFADGVTFNFASALILYAVWQVQAPPSFTVSFQTVLGTGGVSGIGGPGGTSVSLPTGSGFSSPGYTFAGWNTAADGSGSSYASGTAFVLNTNQILYAQWSPNQYVVTFSPNGGSVNVASSTYVYGSAAISLPASSNTNFTFIGWYTAPSGGALIGTSGAGYTPAQSLTLYAQWSPNQYVVTFSPNGGSVNVASLTYAYGGTTLTLPTPTNANAVFNGWYTAPSGGTLIGAAGASYTPGQTLTLYAQWSPNQYVVTYAPDGGTVDVTSSTFVYGSTPLTLRAPTNTHFTFNGWFTVPSGGTLIGAAGASYQPTQSLTLYAQWSSDQYVVTYAPNGGIVNVTSSTFVYGDSALTLPVPTDTNFTFDGWFTAPSGGTLIGAAGARYQPTRSLTLYAQWAQIPSIVLSFVSNGGGGTVAPLSGLLNSPVTLPGLSSLARPGYTLSSWNSALDGTGASYQLGQLVTLTIAMTLYAQWTTVPLIVVSFASNGGSGSVAPESGPSNTSVTLPGSPSLARQGYTLASWNAAPDGTGTSYALGQYVTLTAAMTLYAQWTALPLVDVSFASNGGSGLVGAVSGSPNTSVTLPSSSSLARPGYTLSSWNVAPDGTGTSYALGQNMTLSTSLTLYAQWTALSTIELKFVTDGGSGSAPPLIGVVGANVTLPGSTSVVKSGFTFTSWNTTANGSGTSYKLGEGVTLSTSMTLYAQWKGTPTAVLYGAVGLFTKSSTKLTPSLKTQIQELAKTIKAKKYKKVTLFGYSVATGTTSLDREISAARATVVADFLRSQLKGLKVQGVSITAAGEGSIAGKTAPTYARVEVFVL
jgi:uncharacterized repeat protein (TIGR02543 family)